MKIAVWKTGHSIADTVGDAVYEGLKLNHCDVSLHQTSNLSESLIEGADIHVAYGILRGCKDVFQAAKARQKDYVELDNGYWKPGHFDGYYRVSLNGTQQTTGLDKLEPDYERWDRLGIAILDDQLGRDGLVTLVCPPTDHVQDFFMPGMDDWINCDGYIKNRLIRDKRCERPLNQDFDDCNKVITFNSSVGWEALRQGIPVVSDEQHSICGAYQKLVAKDISQDYNQRRKLFGIMSGLQLRLEEIRSGLLCPLINRLLAANNHL